MTVAGLVNVEKAKYTLLLVDQNAGQNRDKSTEMRSFENVAQFKRLETTVQNLIPKEFKGRLNCGNACYNSVQNLLSSRLLSKNVRVRAEKPSGNLAYLFS
jgi:hypothetical protein